MPRKLKVLIQGPDPLAYMYMLLRGGFVGTRDITEADVVLFTGGPDVDPILYGETALETTFIDPFRDASDIETYHKARELEIFMVGICRGGQFLNVMSGGSLWQDVDGHTRGHSIIDLKTCQTYPATSTHHQMMIPGANAEVRAEAFPDVALTKRSSKMTWTWLDEDENSDEPDIEVVTYPGVLCFQPHPEIGPPELQGYFIGLVHEYWSEYIDLKRKGNIACAD